MRDKGFTLVELAIAMVIIGLLIGGILKGIELVEQARVKKVVSFVKSVTAAHSTFIEKYNAVAGDMRMAQAMLPGCTGECVGGTGDGRVGAVVGVSSTQARRNTLPEVETTMFWRHLALANLITGIDVTAPVMQPSFGTTHPGSPFGGGFEVTTLNVASGDLPVGLVLKFQAELAPSSTANVIVSPDVARQIDIAMDDGMPDTGTVKAEYEVTDCDTGGQYQPNDEGGCLMFFSISHR